MKKLCVVIFLFLVCYMYQAQTILNAYARVSAITGNSVLAVSDVNIANHSFTVGGMVVVMQMQDNVIGTNTTNANSFGNLASIASAGLYEIRTIASVSPAVGTPTAVALTSGLVNTYNINNNSRVQLISFRNMGLNYTTTGHISGLTWNGDIGGVVAFYVTNTLTLNHQILANGLGFRGGAMSGSEDVTCANTVYITNSNLKAFKGEGIYRSTNVNFTNGRAKIISGGGGGSQNNTGGGGGGNYTSGGGGGLGWNCTTTNSGFGIGGLSLSAHINSNRVFMGGGGGGGQQNNGVGSAGGNGGGIILIKATTFSTSTSCGTAIQISANGNAAANSGNDGAGGGGAAGSIVIEAGDFSINPACPLTVRTNGGNGGNVGNSGSHGGGGGGGQGAVIYSSAQPTANVISQANNGTAGQDDTGGTISAGSGGGTNGSGVVSSSSGPLPIELVEFRGRADGQRVLLEWVTASETNNDYFTVERTQDGDNYKIISRLSGNGTTREYKQFSTYDDQPEEGLNYYRLKQTDYSGSYNYFPVISVEYSGNPDFSFHPNPVKRGDDVFIRLHKTKTVKDITLTITDMNNKELYTKKLIDSSGHQEEIQLKTDNLPAGVYILKLQNGSFSECKKLLIK